MTTTVEEPQSAPLRAGAPELREGLIFEHSKQGRRGFRLPELDVPEVPIESLLPEGSRRSEIKDEVEVSEFDVIRHFTRLSKLNVSIDAGLYPLGSCTMKYNPRLNEEIARIPGFALSHPLQPDGQVQGNLELLWNVEQTLKEIFGMPRVTLQPVAGAHGELTGILMVHKALAKSGNARKYILIPDSAHGTNPASAAFAGYEIKELKSNSRGTLDLDLLEANVNEDVAALMITVPNTLGVFEHQITRIAEILHRKGAYLYCDGANLNAFVGVARPGDMGIDVIHSNLHKTFSTPHGGGGPGAGPVGVSERLVPFLPTPTVERAEDGTFYREFHHPDSIGRMRAFEGNFGVLVRALTYMRTLGPTGLRRIAQIAVLNANYIRARLKGAYHLPYDAPSLHEVVFSDKKQNAQDVHTLDIAKRLMDYGFHPPTIYFPLIVAGALMIEPTESEPKEELDAFCEAMLAIAHEAEERPELVKSAPHTTPVRRLDEARAARQPVLRWKK
ncbi:MAG TPA: aminomethyl-transferring glycine dehydrogenase subunit GcvPB [Thermoanaerobaculia bacterium]|jgi:glycine dehydrogenase subunit 2|nr:aminomethyl-transferring glycine dehydrogenase subunit GcvPB [Thermoanaerobaculia bacterium]